MPPRKYSEEEQANALGIYSQQGAAIASQLTEIPAGTIASWAHRRGMQRCTAERTAAATEAHQNAALIRWAETRVEVVNGLAGAATSLLELLHDKIEQESVRDAKDTAVTLAVVIDKAQLLSGHATGRIEHSDANGELATEVARLVEERRSVAPGTVSLDSRRTA